MEGWRSRFAAGEAIQLLARVYESVVALSLHLQRVFSEFFGTITMRRLESHNWVGSLRLGPRALLLVG